MAQFGINITHTGAIPPLSVVFSGQPGYQNPYSQQAEFGIERAVGGGMSISVSGIYAHTLRLPVAIDINNLPGAPFTTRTLANGQTVSFRNWGSPACGVVVNNPCFANLLRLQSDQYSSLASALYEGAILEVKKRFSNHLTLLGNYTFSKAFATTGDFNSDFGPQDQTNLAGEHGLSNFDQRHKIVVAGVLESPWKDWFTRGFQLSPIFRYNSGHPFDLLAGTNVNNDRHSTNDRAIGAASNTGLGPNSMTFDMRLSRRFKMGEKAKLELMAEGFNLSNRTNFGSVNNVLGANLGLQPGVTSFNSPGYAANIGDGVPNGFTSALPSRQLQFGARLSF